MRILAVLGVAVLSLGIAAIVMRLTVRWLRGSGAWVVDWLARKRWR